MSPDDSPSRTRSAATYIAMFAVTAAIGFGVGFLAAWIGANVLGGSLGGFGSLVGALSGLIIGYPVGVIVGLIVIKRRFHYGGSLWRGILGSALGVGITISLAEPLHFNLNPNLLFAGLFAATPLLAVAAFHWWGRRKTK